MRDTLNKSLEMLIWVATSFLVILSCYTGAMIIRLGGAVPDAQTETLIGGFLTIIFGVTMSFVFAGISFQIMDIRSFTKHTAIGLKRMSR
jgi:high-affinity Fe2+/Pb2+ permease